MIARTNMNTLDPYDDPIDRWESSDTFQSKAIAWALGDDTTLSIIFDRYAVSEQYDDDYDAWCGK